MPFWPGGRGRHGAAGAELFAAHGGKLILYHGWADQLITPYSTVDYYANVERAMGGFRASQTFSRLYLVPGAYHCLFGYDGEFKVSLVLPPNVKGVEAAEVTVPAGQSEAKLVLRVPAGTPPGNRGYLIVRATTLFQGKHPTQHDVRLNVNVVK